MKLKKPNTIVRAVCAGAGLTLCCLVPVYATGGDPLTIVNNLSDFIFSVIKAIEKPIAYFLHRMGHAIEDTIEIQLLLCMDAGSVFEDDGIRYYMNSREAGKHNEPHVHVDIRHETSGSFSIITGKKLSKGKIKTSDVRKIQMMIANHQAELINFWNEHTDGLTVDLDQAFGLIGY